MGKKECNLGPRFSTSPGSLEEELRQLSLRHPGAKVILNETPFSMKLDAGVTPTVAHGVDPKGREVTFITGPSHVGGLNPEKALDLALDFEHTALQLPPGPLKGAYLSRAVTLFHHAAEEELRSK
ncbi:MAG: hypothetical protein Q8P89_03980 [bacterium]|nr:hypothetical protein [bacterium]